MIGEIPAEELAAVLDAVAMETLVGAGVTEPPVDTFAVARGLGITVADDTRSSSRARYVRLSSEREDDPKPAIFLAKDPRPQRRQWAVAHEIGEHSAWKVFERLGVDPRESFPNARESVANWFANRLLLPSAWFAPDAVACCWDLLVLKSRYATASHELIARRMLDFEPTVILTIFDHGSVAFRRSNVAGQAPPVSAEEDACWRRVHESGETEIASHPVGSMQCWAIHEPDCRREILRTEVEEMGDGGW